MAPASATKPNARPMAGATPSVIIKKHLVYRATIELAWLAPSFSNDTCSIRGVSRQMAGR
jgi:hypothetical protein